MKYFLTAAISLIIGVAGGYFGAPYVLPLLPKDKPTVVQEEPTIKISPIFTTQTATINGAIESIEGNTLKIKSNNQIKDFPISSNFTVYKKSRPNSPVASASADIKSIDISKQALIILSVIDNKYQVVSVSYPEQSAPSQ